MITPSIRFNLLKLVRELHCTSKGTKVLTKDGGDTISQEKQLTLDKCSKTSDVPEKNAHTNAIKLKSIDQGQPSVS